MRKDKGFFYALKVLRQFLLTLQSDDFASEVFHCLFAAFGLRHSVTYKHCCQLTKQKIPPSLQSCDNFQICYVVILACAILNLDCPILCIYFCFWPVKMLNLILNNVIYATVPSFAASENVFKDIQNCLQGKVSRIIVLRHRKYRPTLLTL